MVVPYGRHSYMLNMIEQKGNETLVEFAKISYFAKFCVVWSVFLTGSLQQHLRLGARRKAAFSLWLLNRSIYGLVPCGDFRLALQKGYAKWRLSEMFI